MMKIPYERFQLGSAINFQNVGFTVCSDRGPCVAISLLNFVCDWTFPLYPFLVKRLDELGDDDDVDDDDGGDVDDLDSGGGDAEIYWKSIVVRSRTASPKPWSRSRIVGWSLLEFVSFETYPWDHIFSGPYSDARGDTPRYPERYLKSLQVRSTPHDHFKLYNLFAHVSSF